MKQLFTKPMQSPNNSVSVMKDVIPEKTKEQILPNSNLEKDLTASGNKNLWMGTKSSMTYAKRHPSHHIPNFHKEFTSNENKKIKSVFESIEFILEQGQDGDITYRRNRITTAGTNSSAVPHGEMRKTSAERKPYKPNNGKVETWLDRMPERKKNQGLTYLQKRDTQERKLELQASKQEQ